MEKYLEKLDEEYTKFHKETLTQCYNCKRMIESKMDIKVRVYPTVECLDNDRYQKSICVDIIEENDNVDYRIVEIGLEHINSRMYNSGMPFEDAVYQEFIFTIIYENRRIKEHKGNAWEKILDRYIRDTYCFPDGGNYYLDNEHNLYEISANENSDDIYVVNTESIKSIFFDEFKKMVIYCDKDTEEFDVVVINGEGIKTYKESEYKNDVEDK